MSAETFAYCPRCAKPLAERPIADDGGVVNRRACPDDACGFVQWGNHQTPMGHAFITKTAPQAVRELGRLADGIERLNALLEQLLAAQQRAPGANPLRLSMEHATAS